jgi:hypothetical protein
MFNSYGVKNTNQINSNLLHHFQKHYTTFFNLNFNDKITVLSEMKKRNFELFIIYKKAFLTHFNVDAELYFSNHSYRNKINNKFNSKNINENNDNKHSNNSHSNNYNTNNSHSNANMNTNMNANMNANQSSIVKIKTSIERPSNQLIVVNNIPREIQIPKISFEDFVYNKRVILVGPSSHVLENPSGEWIERFDIIIRLNKSLPIMPELYPFIGRRTDILYNNLNVSDYPGENKIDIEMFLRSGIRHLVSPYPPIDPFQGDIINFIKMNKGIIPFRHIDLNYYRKIENKLGTRPNTGICAIADILNFKIKELYVTGISFFKKNYYKQYRNISKTDLLNVANNSIHTQKPQKIFLRSLYLNDDRVKVDNLLKGILYDDFNEFEMITRKYERDTIFLNMNYKMVINNLYKQMEKFNKYLIFINRDNLKKINSSEYFLITDIVNFPLEIENILYLIGNLDKNVIRKIDIEIDKLSNFNLLVMTETRNLILKKWNRKTVLEKIFFINKKLNQEQKRIMDKGHFNVSNYFIYVMYFIGIIMTGERKVSIFRDDLEIMRPKMTFYETTLMKYLLKEKKINILE